MRKYGNYFLLITAIVLPLVLASCGSEQEGYATERDAKQTVTPLQSIDRVIGPGRVYPVDDIIALSSPVTGKVVNVHKRDGAYVRGGDVLVELERDIESVRIEEMKSRIQTQSYQIVADEYGLKETKVQLENKRKELDRIESLLASGAETPRNFDNIETEVKTLENRVARQRASLDASVFRLNELNVDLKKARIELERRMLRAPQDGIIVEMNAQHGSVLSFDKPFAELIPDTTLIVACEIDELFAGQVNPGQPASIRTIGSNNILAAGEVFYTAPHLRIKSMFVQRPGERQDRRVREVRIELDDYDDLIVNSRVECVIDVNREE